MRMPRRERQTLPAPAMVAQAQDEGCPGELVGGALRKNAPRGALNCIQLGRMTGGFTLITWSASYGTSGIMSFQINQDCVGFPRRLNHDTSRVDRRSRASILT